ncbi:VWA domain-containing protein [Aquisphaera insulae]|uniref:VWA domain-containing protein n=1 Tax=Aquisphaera insulae TaxID=2712864 RepID=UPI00196B2184|nr:VWA domain-containing protein [Aquisphaera insulae]
MPEPGDDWLARQRWRLVLGKFSERSLGSRFGDEGAAAEGASGETQKRPGSGGPSGNYGRMDRALDYLYGREYGRRGVRGFNPTGGDQPSALNIPDWLKDVRELFPRETVEILEKHALERYGMTELVTDAESLRKMEPSYELLKAVMSFRNLMAPDVLLAARKLVSQVVEDLKRKLTQEVRPVLWGKLNRQRRSPLKLARNLDWHRTIRANLKNYDREKRRIVLESLLFSSRVERHLPWHIIMAVDCSGSMMDSVIHSAIMAGIFKGLPAVRVSLVAFDTAVVDLSEHADDPTEVLMSVQLGGGTDIAGAMGYCEGLVQTPARTIVVLVTDFCEGNAPGLLPASVKRLREAGARVLGLAALDAEANPVYDRDMAERCVAAGAEVAALTPRRLAEWMARILS